MPISLILTVLLILFVLTMLAKTVRVIPQGRAGIVERLGKFHAVLNPGLHIVIPVVDRVLPLIDLREQVVSFPSQSVITEDNLVVGIDTVVYFQVTDPRSATYEITNYIRAVDELTSATLRNVVGGLNLEQTLTSRDQINAELRGVLDSTTAAGACASPAWTSRKSSPRHPSRTPWRSRCVQSVTAAPQSSPQKARSSPTF